MFTLILIFTIALNISQSGQLKKHPTTVFLFLSNVKDKLRAEYNHHGDHIYAL